MTHVITRTSAAVGAAMLLATKAFAALPAPPSIPGLAGSTDLKQVIVTVLVTLLDFILLIAVVYVVVAGIRLIVSGGDEGEKDKAKKTITYVIVGIIVVLLARVIVTFVSTLL